MEKIIVITNYNRDGAKIWLEQEDNDIYTIKSNKDYILKYVSINYNILSDNELKNLKDSDIDIILKDGSKCFIISYDPSGGPCITRDYIINDIYNIERIFEKDNNIVFKVKENKK